LSGGITLQIINRTNLIQIRYATLMKITQSNLRKYHLSYCSVCKNKEMTLKEGIICGLTNKKANFIENCENYLEDGELALERVEKVKLKIFEKYPKKNIVGNILSSDYYKSSSEVKAQEFKKVNSKTFKYDPTHFKFLFFFVLIGSVIIAILKLNGVMNLLDNKSEMLNLGFALLFSSWLFYLGFIKEFKNNNIKIDNIGIHFKKSKYGIKYENQSVKWNEILEFGIVTKPNKNYTMHSIIFGTKTFDILEMNISSSEITPEQYVEIIKEKMKNVA
jgi:hypothetical protein